MYICICIYIYIYIHMISPLNNIPLINNNKYLAETNYLLLTVFTEARLPPHK